MKHPLRLYPLAAALVFLPLVHAEYRTFTSKDGVRKIEAEIQSATGDTVTIQVKNGAVTTSRIDLFSLEDQEFIRNWAKDNPAPVKLSFAITTGRSRVNKQNKDTNSHVVVIEDWAYDLNFENRATNAVDNLELRYRIYIKSEHEEEKNKEGYYISDGIIKVARIEPLGRQKHQTKSVPLLNSTLKSGYVHKDGRRDRASDDLVGVWVKVFKDGERVWEYKSATKATTDFVFTDEDALKIGTEQPKKGKK